ncbi:NAD(P)/FAD-dependent oxidoreductase [Pseudonocardiaceae bacterium YIM PH 21723]|nr:NAD(P)/FAD-dependent oxidoreductase [Pseudonocardiaceae bacterium YIM PH 21723]
MAATAATERRTETVSVAIVGTGFSGLGMAVRLKQKGVNDFVILEKADDVGGTWRENTYPGCACDIPSHLYSFSFEQNPDWNRLYPEQREIHAYLRGVMEKYNLREHIRFGSEVIGYEYRDDTNTWLVNLAGGRTVIAGAIIIGQGPLHIPSYPNVPGLESFQGKTMHTATWDHDYDFTGKKVAVIGTGASAVQAIPQIAPQVEQLHVVQRTPAWIMSKPDFAVPAWAKQLFRRLPFTQNLFRALLYWFHEARLVAFQVRALNKVGEALGKAHIAKGIKDRKLRKAVTPDFNLGCKRILISDDYYPALDRPNVNVITDALTEVRANSIVTADGVEHEVDCIVYGTGFKVTDAMSEMSMTGRGGIKLQEAWQDGIESYLGVAIHGFPNAFTLVGANTGLGHNSIVFMIEAQVNYILQALALQRRTKAKGVDVRASVQREFNADIQGQLDRTVWSQGGCKSWYLDSRGVNRTLWPGFTWRYWLRTRQLRAGDFELIN